MDVIALAKQEAARDGTSVSRMFSAMVRARVGDRSVRSSELSPKTRSLVGTLRLPADKSYDDLRWEATKEKFGL
jgi:hypothetical protein